MESVESRARTCPDGGDDCGGSCSDDDIMIKSNNAMPLLIDWLVGQVVVREASQKLAADGGESAVASRVVQLCPVCPVSCPLHLRPSTKSPRA